MEFREMKSSSHTWTFCRHSNSVLLTIHLSSWSNQKMSNICDLGKIVKSQIFLKTFCGLISILPSKFTCKRYGGVLVKIPTLCSACVFLLVRSKEQIGGDTTFCQSSNITLKKDLFTALHFSRIFFLSSIFITLKSELSGCDNCGSCNVNMQRLISKSMISALHKLDRYLNFSFTLFHK